MPTLVIGAKVIGQKRPPLTDFRIPFPPPVEQITLRDLITHIVLEEVAAFRQRQSERLLARVLSPEEIQHGASQGKIDSGERDIMQEVDDSVAVQTALQAFADGLYFVFIDDMQIESLNQAVHLKDESRMMFVRLVALMGG